MSDAGRPPDGADWPPPVPAGIHLRPRAAVAPSDMPESVAPPAAPEPQRGPAPVEAAWVTPPVSLGPPGAVTPTVSEAPPPGAAAATVSLPPPATVSEAPPLVPSRVPVDAPAADGPLLDPAGYRLRLVRDAAAALALLVGVVLVGSLLARPAPTGDVLSATGAPGAADPRGAPGLLLPDPSPDPVASFGPTLSPSPTPGSSATAEPAP